MPCSQPGTWSLQWKRPRSSPATIQCMNRTSEKTLNESGGFLPPGRKRSRRRSESSAANETIMTMAKIARYAQKPGMATVPAAANNAAAAATTNKPALRYAETGIRHFIISAETKWCHTKRWRASRHAIRAGQGSSGRCLRADSLSPCMSTEPSELRLSPYGLENFVGDLVHNGGLPAQVDTRTFAVGMNLATRGRVSHAGDGADPVPTAGSTGTQAAAAH